MRARCYRKSARKYKDYGGRGITVCDEWKDNYESFRDWAMANGYADNLTLDRKDTNRNYEPDNCRWVTNQEQQYNKRTNVNYTCFGKTQCLAAWSEETGICCKTLQKRIDKGWDLERVFSEPPRKTNLIDIAGQRFGRITVISLAHTNHGAHWNCVCDCGSKKVIKGYNLISGATKSCGCLQKEISSKQKKGK